MAWRSCMPCLYAQNTTELNLDSSILTENCDESGRWSISNVVACCACVRAFVSLVHSPKPNDASCRVDLHAIVTFKQLTILQRTVMDWHTQSPLSDSMSDNETGQADVSLWRWTNWSCAYCQTSTIKIKITTKSLICKANTKVKAVKLHLETASRCHITGQWICPKTTNRQFWIQLQLSWIVRVETFW